MCKVNNESVLKALFTVESNELTFTPAIADATKVKDATKVSAERCRSQDAAVVLSLNFHKVKGSTKSGGTAWKEPERMNSGFEMLRNWLRGTAIKVRQKEQVMSIMCVCVCMVYMALITSFIRQVSGIIRQCQSVGNRVLVVFGVRILDY